MAPQSEFKLLDRRTLPEGFRYQPDFISAEQEQQLLDQIRELPFQAFQFRGFEGKRRTVSYGWRYDFNQQKLQKADAVADFLLPVREMAGRFAGLEPEALEQVTVIEYSPGSAIGWHKDRPMFGDEWEHSIPPVDTLRYSITMRTFRGLDPTRTLD